MKLHIKICVHKNLIAYTYVLCRIYKHVYGIIGADAIGLPVLFTDCAKL